MQLQPNERLEEFLQLLLTNRVIGREFANKIIMYDAVLIQDQDGDTFRVMLEPLNGRYNKPRTRIMLEEFAYNTYSGSHSRSQRRGTAIFPDGKIRSVTLGTPDTFFSIPAHARINGRYVSGFVTRKDDEYYFHLNIKYQATPTTSTPTQQ